MNKLRIPFFTQYIISYQPPILKPYPTSYMKLTAAFQDKKLIVEHTAER